MTNNTEEWQTCPPKHNAKGGVVVKDDQEKSATILQRSAQTCPPKHYAKGGVVVKDDQETV